MGSAAVAGLVVGDGVLRGHFSSAVIATALSSALSL